MPLSNKKELTFLQNVLQNADTLLMVLDGQGRIRCFNPACERLSGYRQTEVEDKSPWDFLILAEASESARLNNFEALSSSTRSAPTRFTNHWISKKGEHFLIEWAITRVFDAEGKFECLISVGADITERARYKNALQEKCEILDQIHDSVISTDLNGVITNWNKGAERIFGYASGEMLGQAVSRLYPEDQLNFLQQEVIAPLKKKGSHEIEVIMQRRNGARFYGHLSLSLQYDANQQAVGMIGYTMDVTARKEADDALRASNQIIAAVLDTTPVLIAYLDAAFNFVWVNTAYALADNQEPAHFVGKNYFALFPNTQNEAIFRQVLESGEPHFAAAKPFEYPHNLEQGPTTHWDWTLTPIKDNHKTVTGLVLSLTNVTALIEALEAAERSELGLMALTESLESRILERTRDLSLAKEMAERANFAKSQFLSRMSHELRTPLNAILGFVQVLNQDTTSPEDKDYLNEINRAGHHLLNLINELLDLSRIETGYLSVQMQPVPLNEILAQSLNITQRLMNAQNIALLNYCDNDSLVLADSTRLCQILVNLLSNATKYNRHGGRITVTCHKQAENRLRIAVTDTGPGIAADKLPLLFQPFERLGAELTAVEGVGIGLALSKQLAELMGGRVGVESSPGQGSTFWLELTLAELPQSQGSTCAEPTPSPTEIPMSKCKVLYVEDNASNLKLVEVILRRQSNITLMSATKGEDGLELARRYHPDAILLDIHLPSMNGYEVLTALKADDRTSKIPVLALTADAMTIDIERGLKAGFLRYITKPVDASELIAAIREVTVH